MTSRKPTAAFWIVVAVTTMLILYEASFGPACWIVSWLELEDERAIAAMYRPFVSAALADAPITEVWGMERASSPTRLLRKYSQLGARKTWGWRLYAHRDAFGSVYYDDLRWEKVRP